MDGGRQPAIARGRIFSLLLKTTALSLPALPEGTAPRRFGNGHDGTPFSAR
jgi:hypothetical protein